MRWFYIDHGIDNYEEVVDLDRIMYWRCSWQLIPNSETWTAEVELLFEGGHKEHISLSTKGYSAFIEAVGGVALYEKYKESGGEDR